MLVPWFASIFEPLYIAWAGIKFEVFRRGGPKLQRSNLFFLWPRRWFFLKLKGNIISDPPLISFQFAINSMREARVSESFFVSTEGLLFFLLLSMEFAVFF